MSHSLTECRQRVRHTSSTADENTQLDSPESPTTFPDDKNWSLHKLWHHDDVPMIFQEPFILTHYRPPKCRLSECLIGMVHPLHNETLNVWTHLISGICFSWVLINLVFHENSTLFMTSNLGLPLVFYLTTAGLYGLLSAAAHLFNTLSMNARHVAFTFDYLAISLYSYGCAAAYRAYSFPRDGESRDEDDDFAVASYLPIALVLAVTSHLVACYTRLEPDPISMIIIHSGRFFAYVVPYFFVSWPIMYRLLTYLFYGETLGFGDVGIVLLGYQFMFAFGSAFFYLSHIPERFMPCRFDVIGHSHQFFHICGSIGTALQFSGILEDFKAKSCLRNDSFSNTTNMWPCEPGSGFIMPPESASSSFLLSSIIGLVVHNLLACSLLAALVVPKVVEKQRHRHHKHHSRPPCHSRGLVAAKTELLSSPPPSSFDKFVAFVKELKIRVVRIGSFRHRV